MTYRAIGAPWLYRRQITGADYLTVRPDGVAELDVHATVTTDSREAVAVRATGLATLGDDGIATGTLALRFEISSQTLAWLNREVGIATTRADMNNGTLELASYTIKPRHHDIDGFREGVGRTAGASGPDQVNPVLHPPDVTTADRPTRQGPSGPACGAR